MSEQRPIKSEDLLRFRLAGDPQISPCGEKIIYTITWINPEKNQYESALWTVQEGKEPVRFTGSTNDSRPRFSPDGRTVAFLSRRSGQSQIWVMPVDGGEARQVTKIQGGVGQFQWMPGGQGFALIAYLSKDGLQPEVKEQDEKDLYKKYNKDVKVIDELFYKLDGVGYFQDKRAQLCVQDLQEGASARQLTDWPYQVGGIADISADGQHVLFLSMRGEDYDREAWKHQLYRVPVAGGEVELVAGGELGVGDAVYSPDGQQIVFTATYPEDMGYDNVKLYLMPSAGGEARLLAPGFDRPFSHLGLSDLAPGASLPLVWAKDGQSVFAPASIDGTVQLVQVSLDGQVQQVTMGDQVVTAFSLNARQDQVALAISTHTNPSDVYLASLPGEPRRLTDTNRDLLAELLLVEPERYYFQAEGGPQVDGWVMKPIGFTAGQKYPAIMEVHGGPMMMYSCSFFFEFQLMAAQGYGVIFTNPRGSQGYGEDFCRAIQYEWGNLDYADVLAGVDAALAQYPWIDSERVAIGGGSYGGYMTAWAVGHTNRFKAAICSRPVVYWAGEVGTTDGGWLWMRRAKGVRPWNDDSWYKQQSPWTYVENMQTPMLLEVQEGDLRCPIEQGQMLYTAVKFLNKAPIRFVRYPNEFHGMSRNGQPWHRLHRLDQIVQWLEKYL